MSSADAGIHSGISRSVGRPGVRETVKVLSRASIEMMAGFIDESSW